MSLPVYVINLDFRRERWETLSESAARHAPRFALHRIEAINGKTLELAGFEGADQERFRQICGRPILPGEYGCYYSHIKALEQFVADGAPAGLILEDDVVFDQDSAARISALLEEIPEFSLIKIVNHRSSMLIELGETARGDTVGRTIHGPQGSAAAYLVSREAAQKLLDGLKAMILPWDVALERFWDHDASVLSTATNLLPFSDHVTNSNIAHEGYDSRKFPWYERLGTALFRTIDYSRRVHHVLKRPTETMVGPTQAFQLPVWAELSAGLAVLLLISAVWYESDVYRFAGLALTIPALVRYFRTDLWSYSGRPYIGVMGSLCLLWGAYVAVRFAYSYLVYPEYGQGSSEGIYMFTLLYPSLGVAFLLFVKRPFLLATLFMLISAVALSFGIDYGVDDATRALTLLQNNPIHASVGAGFIALLAVPYLIHVIRRPGLDRVKRAALMALASATFLVALLAIYNLWSKGVWLAMAVSLPLLAIIIVATDAGRWGRKIALAAILIAIAGTALNFDTLRIVAGPTIETAVALTRDVVDGVGLHASLDAMITAPSTEMAQQERMMLWANALNIWAERPLFGAGISWLHEWQNRQYQDTSFNLLHNGYLEVAVRYGLVGLAFYALLTAWTLRRSWQAARAGLIDMTAFQAYAAGLIFFAVTLLSNSNIRLAIGESFMWTGAGFGFYCHYLLQRRNARRG